MAYATVHDMVLAFGEQEMTQLSTADGADMAGVDATLVQPALDTTSSYMDSFLRRRYAVPVPASFELVACCADLARMRLANGRSNMATDGIRSAAKAATAWLEKIAEGKVTLDGAVPQGSLSGARVQDRTPDFRAGPPLRTWS